MFLGMATTMTVPMVGWMIYRGHGWRANAEMSASMFVPTFAVIGAADDRAAHRHRRPDARRARRDAARHGRRDAAAPGRVHPPSRPAGGGMSVASQAGRVRRVLALVFAGAALAGSRLDVHPGKTADRAARHGRDGRRPQPVRGLAVSEKGLTLELARRTAPQGSAVRAGLPDRRRSRADRARLRRRAHQAHALHRRAARHDRLPAPAPDRERRRHVVASGHAPRGGRLPRVRRLQRRRASPTRSRTTHRRRLAALAAAARSRRRRRGRWSARRARRGRHEGRRGIGADASRSPERASRSRSRTTWAPRATSWRCARATSRSCTCTPTRTA